MPMKDFLWFHDYKPSSLHHDNTITNAHFHPNDVCYSTLFYKQLSHTGDNVMDTVHIPIKDINIPLKPNNCCKRSTCLPNKICKNKYPQQTRVTKHNTKPRVTKQKCQNKLPRPTDVG